MSSGGGIRPGALDPEACVLSSEHCPGRPYPSLVCKSQLKLDLNPGCIVNSVVWASYIVTLYLSLLLCHAGRPRNLEIEQGTCWSHVGSGKMLSLSVMKEGETAMWLCWRTLTQVPGMDAGYSPGTKIFNSSPRAY